MGVTQADFRAALLDGAIGRPSGLTDSAGRAAGRRFDVYRNNVAVSLTEALAAGFPATVKLLGETNFKSVAGVFLRQSPPATPLMMHYGAGFPEFLAGFPPLAHLGYLGDVAALELALRRSYHAADAAPMAPDNLAAIPPDAMPDVTFTFAPAVELIRSPWHVHAIWAFNMDDGPKPEAIAQDVLVLRPAFDPEPHPLPPGAYEALSALMNGQPLGTAADRGTAAHGAFDLGALLAQLLAGNALTGSPAKA